jgi:ribosome-associated translation inhibitor RaiA
MNQERSNMTRNRFDIEVYAKGFDLTQAIRAHVLRRLGFALDRFAGRIRRAEVRLGDLNGPKGGHDKYCRIVVSVGSDTGVVEENHSDLYRAVDRAARILASRVERMIGRANRPATRRFASRSAA